MTALATLAEIHHALLTQPARRRFIIPGVLPAGPAILFGPSGSAKTGLVIRMSMAIAGGLAWGGRQPVPGSVLYCAGEDYEGVKERMVAAAQDLGLDPSVLPVAVVEPHPSGFVSGECRSGIEAAAKELERRTGFPVALVVVDTLAACFGPKSQDDATPAGEYMHNADRLARNLGCCCLSIHHVGKNEQAGMRGSRVFFDRADGVLEVKKGRIGTSSFLHIGKARNAPGGQRFAFDIAGIDVPTFDGSISVQVVRNLNAIEAAPELSKEEVKERRNLSDAGSALMLLRNLAVEGKLAKREWQEACFAHWSSKPSSNARSQAFSTALRKLATNGDIIVSGDIVSMSMSEKTAHPLTHNPSPIPP